MKDKYLSLNEVKAMTKDEFKQLLISQGFDVEDYPGKYRLIISCDDKDNFNFICSLYGALGYYSSIRQKGIIGCWGCNDSIYEYLPQGPSISIKEILSEIGQHFNTEIKQYGCLSIVTIFKIPEKTFREIMVEYGCSCTNYNTDTHEGSLRLFRTPKNKQLIE